MELLIRFLPLIKIGGVFTVMLVSIRMRLSLWLSILLGSFLLAIFFGLGPVGWARYGLTGSLQEKSIMLSAVVGLIMLLSDMMDISGQAERMMNALRGYLNRPKLRLVFFPALIGLLPMPGGAIFSAPMVRSASSDLKLSETDRALINYWFRHLWEMCWPLYPGVILAAALAKVPVMELLSWLWPGTVAAILLGWFFVLRPLKFEPNGDAESGESSRHLRPAILESLPIITAIVGSLALESLFGWLFPDWPMEIGVLSGLFAAVVVCIVQNRLGFRRILPLLGRKHLHSMLLIILAIFVFKETLMNAGAIKQLASLAGGEAALMAAAVLLPFLTGVVSGITIAFVGASFPLLIGMLEQLNMTGQLMPYVTLAMFSGFTGVMISPMHACFLLSCQYFKVDLGPCWRRVLRPVGGLALFGAAYSLLLINT